MRIERIPAIDLHAAGQHLIENAERAEDVCHVVVDGDAVTLAAQRVAPLVHAHAPAAFSQRDGRDQAAEARADDFRMAGLDHRASRRITPRPSAAVRRRSGLVGNRMTEDDDQPTSSELSADPV